MNRIGLRTSVTFFLRYQVADQPDNSLQGIDIEVERIEDLASLNKYSSQRLAYVPLEKWFDSGSICYVHTVNGSIVSYIWTHNRGYPVNREVGFFQLKQDEIWIGPIFVDKQYRARGLAPQLVNYALQDQSNAGAIAFYTSLNSRNVPSQLLFARRGFSIFGSTHVRRIGKYQFKHLLLDLNTGTILRDRLN